MRDLSDPRPLHQRIKLVLAGHPEGLSTLEIAALTGDGRQSCASILSKLNAYGAGVEKIGTRGHGPGTKWRLGKPSASGFGAQQQRRNTDEENPTGRQGSAGQRDL